MTMATPFWGVIHSFIIHCVVYFPKGNVAIGSRDLTASSTYLFGSASLIIGFNVFILKLFCYIAFNIWLGIAYLGGKFWGFWVKNRGSHSRISTPT